MKKLHVVTSGGPSYRCYKGALPSLTSHQYCLLDVKCVITHDNFVCSQDSIPKPFDKGKQSKKDIKRQKELEKKEQKERLRRESECRKRFKVRSPYDVVFPDLVLSHLLCFLKEPIVLVFKKFLFVLLSLESDRLKITP